MTTRAQALVVGGGISGLVCAYELQKAGIEVQLLEASPRPGGVIQSGRRDGFFLEHGPQSLSGTAQLRHLCDDLGISDQIVEAPPRAPRYVLINGTLFPVPLSPAAFFTSSLIDAATKWAILRDIFGKSKPPDSDESVASFVRRKFSPQLLERLVAPFVSGIYAGDAEQLSVRSAFPQLYEAEKAAGSVVRGMLRSAKNKEGPRERPTLQSFRAGNETLIRALASKLGPALQTQIRVTGISQQKPGLYEVRAARDGREQSLTAKFVILATPTDVAANLLAQLDPALESPLATVAYAAVAVVSLGYHKGEVGNSLDGFGFLVPRSAGLRTLGSVWNSSLFSGRAPQDHALLTSFVGGITDSAASKLSAHELTTLVHAEISPLLSIKNKPVFCDVTVWPRALPQYNLGHAERLAAVSKRLGAFPGIYLAGNYLRGPAIGSCIEQAVAVAQAVRTSIAE